MAVTSGLPTLLILQEGKGVVTNIDPSERRRSLEDTHVNA